MTDLADALAQQSFWGLDDGRAKRERLRKSAPAVCAPPLPDGPCCGRCRHWNRPHEGNGFGLCGLLCVIRGKVIDGPAKGEIVSIDEAISWRVESEPLATKAFTERCSVFAPMT